MSTQPVGEACHAQQHDRQHGVVAQRTPVQQQRIGGFVDEEAGGRHQKEAPQRPPEWSAAVAESPAAMACVREAEGHQPASHIASQRLPTGPAHDDHHHGPVHQRGGAADRDEPVDATALGEPLLQTDVRHGESHDSRRRFLCIAVDDYGLHAGINQAALLLAAGGRVQAIGCMVGGAAWSRWSRALVHLDRHHAAGHGVDLGLHLDLTETAAGPFGARPLWRLMLDCWSHRIDRPQLRAEIRRQLDAFEHAIGRPPDYVDGHQHVHQFPAVRSELIDELRSRHGNRRPWLRSTRRPVSTDGGPFGLKSRLIEALGSRALAAAARNTGFGQNRRLLGVHDFSADAQAYAIHLHRWLADADTADLLMCHPSLAFDGSDPIIQARLAEFEVLSGDGFGRWLVDAGIVLRPMSRILAGDAIRHPR